MHLLCQIHNYLINNDLKADFNLPTVKIFYSGVKNLYTYSIIVRHSTRWFEVPRNSAKINIFYWFWLSFYKSKKHRCHSGDCENTDPTAKNNITVRSFFQIKFFVPANLHFYKFPYHILHTIFSKIYGYFWLDTCGKVIPLKIKGFEGIDEKIYA